jgi:electron transfer flavoprotein alpha subunit
MKPDILVVVEHVKGQVAEITYVMLAAARALADAVGAEVSAVLLGHGAESFAADLAADRVLYMDHPALAEFTPDAYAKAVAALVSQRAPRAVLCGDTSIGADIASTLSARLGLPIVSACRTFGASGGPEPTYSSQVYGGKILVEGPLPGPTALVLMAPGGYKPEQGRAAAAPPVTTVEAPDLGGLKVSFAQYVEPETGDVDISKASVLVAVGRGIQREDNIEMADELAQLLDGAVCASRPIVDQGWLPSTRLVGKSGHAVSPTLYLALGISGAPEHVEGIGGSKTIVAVNTDPAAPIFDVARFGTTADLFDLLPVLTEAVKAARGL